MTCLQGPHSITAMSLTPRPQIDSHSILHHMHKLPLGTSLSLSHPVFSKNKLRKSELRPWFSPVNLLEKQIIGSQPSFAEL